MLTTIEMIRRIVFAILLGAIIGIEREKFNKPAGIRTYILVAAGSCLAMLTGIYVTQGTDIDPTRIGSQVISGIGFLGAGTILRYGTNVVGLTTAAGLWVMAGIGLAMGAGMYEVSIFTTITIFALLLLIPYIERYFAWKKIIFHLAIRVSGENNELYIVTQLIQDIGMEMRSIDVEEDRRGYKILTLCLAAKDKTSKMEFLQKLKEIEEIEIVR